MNLMFKFILFISIGLPLKSAALCSTADSSDRDKSSLIIYGDGFSFAVKEPFGWKADCENAEKLGSNVIFYRKNESLKNTKTLIRIRLNGKTDENIAADLEHDVNGYKQTFKDSVKFSDLEIVHPKYKLVSKLFFIPDNFFEYVVYLNPGQKSRFVFSFSMNKQKQKATPDEIETFKIICGSILLIRD